MDLLELIIEFHKDNERQGPGSEEATLKALKLIPYLNERTKILDVGCGTGGQTMLLLKDNVQLLAELPVRKLPDIMTLSQERKKMPPMMWA